jgi:preprotein translocase subunit SecB
MSDATAPQQAPKISIISQYIRDLSFENAAAQRQASQAQAPDIKVGVNLDAKPLGDDKYEVILKINANASGEGGALFVAELEYAGVFKVQDVPQQLLHPFLMTECPRQLFPFARRIMADVTRDGGFPPLMLDVIDFMQIYRAEVERRQAATAAAAATGQVGNA